LELGDSFPIFIGVNLPDLHLVIFRVVELGSSELENNAVLNSNPLEVN
jgi:hypothetical protein